MSLCRCRCRLARWLVSSPPHGLAMELGGHKSQKGSAAQSPRFGTGAGNGLRTGHGTLWGLFSAKVGTPVFKVSSSRPVPQFAYLDDIKRGCKQRGLWEV